MKVDISYNEDGQVVSKIEIIPQDIWNVDVTAAHLIAALMKSYVSNYKNNTLIKFYCSLDYMVDW